MPSTVYFVGVATAGSRILSLFPRWMDILGIDARIEGVDLPLGSAPGEYRALVRHIAAESTAAGAVITSHKLGIYEAARDLFGATDQLVPLCREVSGISKRGDHLMAFAPDSVCAGAALEAMLGVEYWSRHRAHVLCLGAGGAATAIALALLTDLTSPECKPRPLSALPEKLTFVDIDRARLAAIRRLVDTVNRDARVEYVCQAAAEENDELLSSLPPGSLVINATGMGKDRPGSPLSGNAEFPERAVVWDLNYRGALPFLAQARAQQDRRELQVHDGWLYFLHGWARTLSAVLQFELTEAVFEELRAAAG